MRYWPRARRARKRNHTNRNLNHTLKVLTAVCIVSCFCNLLGVKLNEDASTDNARAAPNAGDWWRIPPGSHRAEAGSDLLRENLGESRFLLLESESNIGVELIMTSKPGGVQVSFLASSVPRLKRLLEMLREYSSCSLFGE